MPAATRASPIGPPRPRGADVRLEFVSGHAAGQQAQLLCGAAAVERVDDVEDALFQLG